MEPLNSIITAYNNIDLSLRKKDVICYNCNKLARGHKDINSYKNYQEDVCDDCCYMCTDCGDLVTFHGKYHHEYCEKDIVKMSDLRSIDFFDITEDKINVDEPEDKINISYNYDYCTSDSDSNFNDAKEYIL